MTDCVAWHINAVGWVETSCYGSSEAYLVGRSHNNQNITPLQHMVYQRWNSIKVLNSFEGDSSCEARTTWRETGVLEEKKSERISDPFPIHFSSFILSFFFPTQYTRQNNRSMRIYCAVGALKWPKRAFFYTLSFLSFSSSFSKRNFLPNSLCFTHFALFFSHIGN